MARKLIHPAVVAGAVIAVTATMTAAAAGTSPHADQGPHTTTPIKHVVVIIGENHSFDNVFATYQPPRHQTIRNLLSEGIITKNGDPGPNYAKAAQLTASDTEDLHGDAEDHRQVQAAATAEHDLRPASLRRPEAGRARTRGSPANLPDGPYQITKYVPYFDSHLEYSKFGQCELFGAYMGDPLHRFYQMWQQSAGYHDRLATWVANTAGDGNGVTPPGPTDQGSVSDGLLQHGRGRRADPA